MSSTAALVNEPGNSKVTSPLKVPEPVSEPRRKVGNVDISTVRDSKVMPIGTGKPGLPSAGSTRAATSGRSCCRDSQKPVESCCSVGPRGSGSIPPTPPVTPDGEGVGSDPPGG